jgi:integrase
MSINTRRLSDGRTVYDVRLRDPLGRHYKRTFRTKRDAEDFASKERSEQRQGTWIDPNQGKVALAEFATSWLKSRVTLRARTRELYEGQLRRYIIPSIGHVEIGELSSAVVRAWYASLFDTGLHQSTCAKAYRLLRTILGTAVDDGLILKNPCTIKGAGVAHSPERPIATVEEIFALADAIEPRFRVAVLLATFGGLRVGELLALTRERIDFEGDSVVVIEQFQELASGGFLVGPPKSEAGRRVVSLPDFMMDELALHSTEHAEPGPSGRLFRGAEGGPLRRAVLQRAWDRARKKVGLPYLHFHDLRHTGNTLAAATGASTKELMARMGHASSEAALRYQHATRERDVTIAARLNRMVDETVGDRAVVGAKGAGPQPKEDSNIASLDAHREARRRATADVTAETTRHGRAMRGRSDGDAKVGDSADQEDFESGRRESNPRSQLGKLMFCR